MPAPDTAPQQAIEDTHGLIPRWVTPLYLVLAAALIPWIIYLDHTLPQRQLSPNYRLAWVGFDAILLGQLARTGYLALRPGSRPYVAHHATASAYLLIVDAWFDITTAATTGDRMVAITLAALVELPLAGVCRWLAFRIERTRTGSEAPAVTNT
jgi:hypothetical protein